MYDITKDLKIPRLMVNAKKKKEKAMTAGWSDIIEQQRATLVPQRRLNSGLECLAAVLCPSQSQLHL